MKKSRFVNVLFWICSLGYTCELSSQESNPIETAVPFLLIVPDAASAGMGELGLASRVDAFSNFHNPAKLVFSEESSSLGMYYVPWLNRIVNDVFLTGAMYSRILNARSSLGASLNYYTLGAIDLSSDIGQPLGTERPSDLSIDLHYALLLGPRFSMSVGMRYIRSDLAISTNDSDLRTVNTAAFDLYTYYRSLPIKYKNFDMVYRFGLGISNIGPKVQVSEGGESKFIPTNLKLGASTDFLLNSSNRLSFLMEFSKLLVPTPPILENGQIVSGKSNDVSAVTGIFQSFGDAPGGFKEELQEITYAFGLEYSFEEMFFLRTGYFGENQSKGVRNYLTLGSGFQSGRFRLDLSYMFNQSKFNTLNNNVFRVSLGINFG